MKPGRRLFLRCLAALLLTPLVSRHARAEHAQFIRQAIALLSALPGLNHLKGTTHGALPIAAGAPELHQQILAEGASGKTVEISGWIVSRSESLLYDAARRDTSAQSAG